MRYRYFLYYAIFFLACRKEKSDETLPATCGYSPYTNGSIFTFVTVNNNRDSLTYTQTVTGDTLLDGRSYAKVVSDSFTIFISCINGYSYQFIPAINLPDYQAQEKVNLFLIENKPLGGAWTDTVSIAVSGVLQTGLLQYSVIEKGISKTVYGRQFRNVVGIKQDAALLIGGTAVPIGTLAINYYAMGVGPIQRDREHDTTWLKDYTIR